jgi:hypothetical protein
MRRHLANGARGLLLVACLLGAAVPGWAQPMQDRDIANAMIRQSNAGAAVLYYVDKQLYNRMVTALENHLNLVNPWDKQLVEVSEQVALRTLYQANGQ